MQPLLAGEGVTCRATQTPDAERQFVMRHEFASPSGEAFQKSGHVSALRFRKIKIGGVRIRIRGEATAPLGFRIGCKLFKPCCLLTIQQTKIIQAYSMAIHTSEIGKVNFAAGSTLRIRCIIRFRHICES